KGSGNRGGRFYQFLAVFLAYVAIGLMLIPLIIEDQLAAQVQPDNNSEAPAEVGTVPKAPMPGPAAKVENAPQPPAGRDRPKDEKEPKAAMLAADAKPRQSAPVPPPSRVAAEKQQPAPEAKPPGDIVTAQNQPVAVAPEEPAANPSNWGALVLLILPV